ncbi:DUF5708 family protein [Streptomyces sp. 71268]|uniref:DUF5708 family protein n=1 Tax=Streptomyces sp. 71268 TaxID=3002640 RepID=UPI0023F9E295|nr:DUF5708 family protein [Streptomyces sp. 71268]WEV28147.1 DUF5708 family protein [Streptomyces sp. 71268]
MYEKWHSARDGGRPAGKHLVEGAATAVVGLALWRFTADVHTPVITLRKVGVVLAFIGVAQLLYGAYVRASARGRR